jgi:signal transduction histidine kinase
MMLDPTTVRAHDDARRLGRIIRSKAWDIEQRWLDRLQDEVAKAPQVSLTHLRDGIGDYLEALHRFLIGGGPSDSSDAAGAAIWARIAREHGITRVRIGFDIDQLVHEFVVLRHVIRDVAAEHGIAAIASDGILGDLVDAAIAQSVRAYVDARDYETRKAQAENIGFLIHELRNPLSAAMQAASAVRDGEDMSSRALDVLDRSHRRLSKLIDSVLDAERLEAGEVEPHPKPIREEDLLQRATDTALRVARDKGVTLEIRGTAGRMLEVDPDLTCSAIQNLVDNAVKYTDLGEVAVAVVDTEDAWSVHVRDNCAGLSCEELRTIFEPFRRGSTTKQGTGLGLSIARRAIEAQGGTIHAESPAAAAGCHFWIRLPKPVRRRPPRADRESVPS